MPNATGGYGALKNIYNVGEIGINPPKHSYDKIEFFGQNTGVKLDNIWGRNIEMTLDIYNAMLNGYTPAWVDTSYLMVSFRPSETYTPNGGNIIGLTDEITNLYLYRHEVKLEMPSIFYNRTRVADISLRDGQITNFTDYGAEQGKTYIYSLFLNTDVDSSSPFISNAIMSQYSGYFLIDVENNKSYKIDVDVEHTENTLTSLYTKHETSSKYPVFSVGNPEYMNLSFGGMLLVDRNDANTNTLEYLKEFRTFVTSPGKKIFKTRKGDMWNVFVSDYSESVINVGIPGQPMVSRFTITQVGEVT